MDEPLPLVLAWVAGLLLGALFYGGLWWTVRRAVSSGQPALLFLGSMLARTGIALAGFYFVGGGRWQRLCLCLVGFVMARLAVTWLTRLPPESQTQPAQEASHAP